MKKFTQKFTFIFITAMVFPIVCLVILNEFLQKAMAPQMPNLSPMLEAPIDLMGSGAMAPIANMPIIPPPSPPPIIIPQLVILLAGVIICVFLVKYLNKTVVKPLENIVENLKEIKNDNLNIKFKTDSENEVLQTTFVTLNDMVEGLKEKETLRKSFLQELAHDLRVPALIQDRVIDILQREFPEHELLSGLKENNEKHIDLINIILEAMINEKISINKTYVNLTEIVENVKNIVSPSLKEKNINFSIECALDFTVFADYTALNRIFLNLISNAAENLPSNKNIVVKGIKNNSYKIIVEDNGNGIAPEFLPFLFEKYASLNRTSQKSVKGLGMALTKELVEKSGGTILVESEVQKFTRFTIDLPLEK